MTIENIKNQYAIEQGYSDWTILLLSKSVKSESEHWESVIQLIQDELKKKIAEEAKVKVCHEEYRMSWHEVDKESIIKIENIK